MSLLQRIDPHQKADHCHPAFRPSGVMNSDVSEVTETDEDILIPNAREAPRLVSDDVLERAPPVGRSSRNMWPLRLLLLLSP
jgi:hypothetical protein